MAPGCQPPEPSLCHSGKRPWGGWRSRSEQPQPHRSRDQQRGPRTLQPAPAWLQPGAQPQPPGAQQTTRTARPTGGPSHPDRQTDRQTDPPACTALVVYCCLAPGRGAGPSSGALLPGLRAVQPVLGDGARVAGLHQVHALGAQVDAVIVVWEGGKGGCQHGFGGTTSSRHQPHSIGDGAEPEEPPPSPMRVPAAPQPHPRRRSRRSAGSRTWIPTASRSQRPWSRSRYAASSRSPNAASGGSCTSCAGGGTSSGGAAATPRRSCRPWQRPAARGPPASLC